MRVVSIAPVGSLTDDERDLLDELLTRHPGLQLRTLLVYEVAGGFAFDRGRRIVAPEARDVGVGSFVVTHGGESIVQRVRVTEDEDGQAGELEATELRLVEGLVVTDKDL